jgi:hypothetical protein
VFDDILKALSNAAGSDMSGLPDAHIQDLLKMVHDAMGVPADMLKISPPSINAPFLPVLSYAHTQKLIKMLSDQMNIPVHFTEHPHPPGHNLVCALANSANPTAEQCEKAVLDWLRSALKESHVRWPEITVDGSVFPRP